MKNIKGMTPEQVKEHFINSETFFQIMEAAKSCTGETPEAHFETVLMSVCLTLDKYIKNTPDEVMSLFVAVMADWAKKETLLKQKIMNCEGSRH